MASVMKFRDKWRCQVRRKGYPQLSKLFARRAEAVVWGKWAENELLIGRTACEILAQGPENIADVRLVALTPQRSIKSITDLMDWYLKTDEANAKRSARADQSRAKPLKKYLGKVDPFALTTERLKAYKKARMTVPLRRHDLVDEKPQVASAATAQLELALLHHAYVRAVDEFKWVLPHGIPKLPRTKLDNLRSRRVKPQELLSLIANCHSFEAGIAFELAVETAMRREELMQLDKGHIDLSRRSVLLDKTKTDHPRTVPLSRRAVELLQAIMREGETGPLFTIRGGSVLQALKRAAKRIDAPDIRFHDFRHEAASRLFEKGLNQIEVAKITGHRTLEMLDRYTHLDVSHLVRKLDAAEPDAQQRKGADKAERERPTARRRKVKRGALGRWKKWRDARD